MRKINGAHDDCEPQPVHDTDIPRAARSAKTASTNTPNHCHSPDTGSRSQLSDCNDGESAAAVTDSEKLMTAEPRDSLS